MTDLCDPFTRKSGLISVFQKNGINIGGLGEDLLNARFYGWGFE